MARVEIDQRIRNYPAASSIEIIPNIGSDDLGERRVLGLLLEDPETGTGYRATFVDVVGAASFLAEFVDAMMKTFPPPSRVPWDDKKESEGGSST